MTRYHLKPGSVVKSGGALWTVGQRGGVRDLKPVGAAPSAVVLPRARAAAKAAAMAIERRQRDLDAFDRMRQQNERALSRKAGE